MEAAASAGGTRPVAAGAVSRVASEPPVPPSRPWWCVSPLAWLPLLLIRIYQWTLSPFLGATCRFEPSCSRYAAECLRRFGLVRGVWLGARRLLCCHPFHPGGYDPPPRCWTDRPARARREGGR